MLGAPKKRPRASTMPGPNPMSRRCHGGVDSIIAATPYATQQILSDKLIHGRSLHRTGLAGITLLAYIVIRICRFSLLPSVTKMTV